MTELTNIKKIYEREFPKLTFELKQIQELTIESILRGNNTLCWMPTGSGKSLIYWIAGKALGGMTIVISPLTALIDEQCEKIREQEHTAIAFHSGIKASDQYTNLSKIYNGELKPAIIFVRMLHVLKKGTLTIVFVVTPALN